MHIEVSHTLNTDSYIKAIIRFMSRRGLPLQIISDNGTNFRGANNELRGLIDNLSTHEMNGKFPEIEWRFNPPSSPHFGSAWERLVQSVKAHLHEVLKSKRPSDKTLNTCLVKIEEILNSRPLTHVQLETSDQEALTPNHLIHGTSDGRKPFFDTRIDEQHYKKQWRTAQQIAQLFWSRWIREYLPTITRRTKWFKEVNPIEVGDVVVIVDEKTPYNTWPKGIIEDVNPGKDGQLRSAVVRVNNSRYTKPATKLAVLDVIDKNLKTEVPIGGDIVKTGTTLEI